MLLFTKSPVLLLSSLLVLWACQPVNKPTPLLSPASPQPPTHTPSPVPTPTPLPPLEVPELWVDCASGEPIGPLKDVVWQSSSQRVYTLAHQEKVSQIYRLEQSGLVPLQNQAGQCLNPALQKVHLERDGADLLVLLKWPLSHTGGYRLIRIYPDGRHRVEAELEIDYQTKMGENTISTGISDLVVSSQGRIYVVIQHSYLGEPCPVHQIVEQKLQFTQLVSCYSGVVDFDQDEQLYVDAISAPPVQTGYSYPEPTLIPLFLPRAGLVWWFTTDSVYVSPQIFWSTQYQNRVTQADFSRKEMTSLAGNGTPGFQDGVGEAARFNGPQALDLDAQGHAYIADSGNFALRKMTPQGEVTTLYQVPEARRAQPSSEP